MKNLLVVLLFLSGLPLVYLSGCSSIDRFMIAQYDPGEYNLINKVRSTAELAQPYCNDSATIKIVSENLNDMAHELKNYSQYLPRNEQTFKPVDLLHVLTTDLQKRYSTSKEINKTYCELKLKSIASSAEEIQKVIALDDLTNEISVFGGINNNLDRLYEPKYYSYDPHIDLDKFINYQEYYWLVTGPDIVEITGTPRNSTSTYIVKNTDVSFIFTPDAYTNNPTLTLYRGQTYKFRVNVPGEGFSVRTNYDTGSLLFKPYINYNSGSLVVYDSKLWRAKQAGKSNPLAAIPKKPGAEYPPEVLN
jgi:hypothetical protein